MTKIKGLQKLTLLDFPQRVACTIFTGGCNFRCPFCHNASLVLDPDRAEGISEEELFAFLEKRKGLLDGVCITGGEPFLQKGIADTVRRIKAMGYAVKLDTNGYYPEALKVLVAEGLVDYVAMDIKNSPALYAKTAGLEELDFSRIEESVRFLMSGAVDYEFRTTVTRELHSKESLSEAAQFIKGAKRYYLQTFIDSGDLVGGSFSAYSGDEMQSLLEAVKAFVPTAQIRGQ